MNSTKVGFCKNIIQGKSTCPTHDGSEHTEYRAELISHIWQH